jgi:hypothetical protein
MPPQRKQIFPVGTHDQHRHGSVIPVSATKLQMSYLWDRLLKAESGFRQSSLPGLIANLLSGGNKMKKLFAAIFAGMFALTMATSVVAAEKKSDEKKTDGKKKSAEKKTDGKKKSADKKKEK